MSGKGKWLVVLCGLLVLAGCGGPPAPMEEESAPPQDDAHVEQEPVIPYEQTVASITPALGESIAQHRERYPDTVGWLRVPGTTIDTAVVQGSDWSNEYYLNHDLDGNPDPNGTYSVNVMCSMAPGTREGLSRNTTVFAHNHDDDPDGILFAQLKRFADPEFARDNPYLFFSGTEEDMAWEVFAVYHTVKQYNYITPEPSWWRWQRILDSAAQASLYDYGIVPGEEDKILTLSTCVFDVPGVGALPTDVQNDYRFVVMARLVAPGEPRKEAAEFTVNRAFLLPDEFPLWDDCIYYEGVEYLLFGDVYDNPCVLPIDRSRLVLRGRIARTTLAEESADWDATYLPEGTEVYYDPDYPMTFVVPMEGEWLPYSPMLENMQSSETKLLLLEEGRTVAERLVDDELLAELWPLIDTMHASPLDEGEWMVAGEPDRRVVMELRLPVYGMRYDYYLDTPAPLGEEVMVVRQFDGLFYRDAAVFAELVAFLRE